MAFFFLLLYITCIYMRPAEWIPFFYGWQLMDFTAVAAVIFGICNLIYLKRGFVRVPENKFMLGFLGALILSHLVHTYMWGAYAAFIDFSRKVILYFLVVNIVNTERRFKITVFLLILWAMVMAVQGFYQYNTGYGLAGQTMLSEGRINWIGIFHDANDFALALVMIVPFLLGFTFESRYFISKIMALPFLGALLYAVYLTNSRGGILALMVVCFAHFVLMFKRKSVKILGAVLGIGFAALVLIFGPSRMAMLSLEEGSAFGRVEAWYEGFQMLKGNPLFGIGKGMFMEDYSLVAHNSFIHTAAESGLVGLFFFMGLFYLCIKHLSLIIKKCDTHRNNPHLRMYAKALLIGLLGFLTGGFFLSRAYIVVPYLFIGLSVALFHIASQRFGGLDERFYFRDFRNVGFLCIVMLGLILTVMKIAL